MREIILPGKKDKILFLLGGNHMAKIDKDAFLQLLDKFIKRSERFIEDAQVRLDDYDVFYYKGQKDVIEELKDMAKNWK
jgi:hypothetical protein